MNTKILISSALLTFVAAAAPSYAATVPTPSLILVAHHDFGRDDLRGLIQAMGYRIISVDSSWRGFTVIGVNHDGTWRIFVDRHGSVKSVTHLSGQRHHHDNDDDDDNNNNGGHHHQDGGNNDDDDN